MRGETILKLTLSLNLPLHIFWVGLVGFILFVHPAVLASCLVSQDPERIIYIGDSHSTQLFGREVEANLKESGLVESNSVLRFAVSGSASIHWYDRSVMRKSNSYYYCAEEGGVSNQSVPEDFPLMQQLIAASPPKAVIIALGTNDIGWNCKLPDQSQTQQVRKLLELIPKTTACVWIGPANNDDGPLEKVCGKRRIDHFVDNLKIEAQKRCTYIDSREIWTSSEFFNWSSHPKIKKFSDCTTQPLWPQTGKPLAPNQGDRLHFRGELARYWADCVSAAAIAALRGHAQ